MAVGEGKVVVVVSAFAWLEGQKPYYTGKCDEFGLDGTGLALTPTLYEQGYEAYKDAVCIPNGAFCKDPEYVYCWPNPGMFNSSFSNTVTLRNMNELIYVGREAFQSFGNNGTIIIEGSFPKLKVIGANAFNTIDPWGDGVDNLEEYNDSCSLNHSFAHSLIALDGDDVRALETVEVEAFKNFAGKLMIQGSFPNWNTVGSGAFFNASTTESLIAIHCRGEPWQSAGDAFDCFKGDHHADEEKVPCPATTTTVTTATITTSSSTAPSTTTSVGSTTTTATSTIDSSTMANVRTSTATTTTTATSATTTTFTTIFDAANVDCSEQQDVCTAACEQGSERNYRILVQPKKNGQVCTGATNCRPGDGQCPTADTATTTTTLTATLNAAANNNSATASNSTTTMKSLDRGMSGGSIAALVIALLLLLVATGFAGWYKGWIKVPAWLSSNRNMHTPFGNDSDGAPLDPAVADMFLNPLATPSSAATTTTIEVDGTTTTASSTDGSGVATV